MSATVKDVMSTHVMAARTAADLMTKPAVTIGPDEPVTHAARLKSAPHARPTRNVYPPQLTSGPMTVFVPTGLFRTAFYQMRIRAAGSSHSSSAGPTSNAV
jgi:hypothetical protein